MADGAVPQDELGGDTTQPNEVVIELEVGDLYEHDTDRYNTLTPEAIAAYDKGRRDERSKWRTAVRVSLLAAGVPPEEIEDLVDKIQRRAQ